MYSCFRLTGLHIYTYISYTTNTRHATYILAHSLPGACMAIWLVSLFFSNFNMSAILRFIQSINLDIRLIASAILLVSWSAVGVDKLDEPKFDSNRAKKRLRTWNATNYNLLIEDSNELFKKGLLILGTGFVAETKCLSGCFK